MNLYESTIYGRRHGFVFLRYVAIFFFFASQLATYFVILNALETANAALIALQTFDVVGITQALADFGATGPFAILLEVMRNLACLVIPLYFVATVAFVLNLNRRDIVSITQRTAIIALIFVVIEFVVYVVILSVVTVIIK